MRLLLLTLTVLAVTVGVSMYILINRFSPIPIITQDLRVELDTGDEPIAFVLGYFQAEKTKDWLVHSRNGGQDRMGSVRLDPGDITQQSIRITYPHSDSVLELSDQNSDGRWTGTWSINRGESGVWVVPATAITLRSQRFNGFEPIHPEIAPSDFRGRWLASFESSENNAVGIFEESLNDPGTMIGTFLTPTGDYRYLAGRVDGDLMRLSTFDGAHAFLFHARMQDDGTIAGDFWSGNWHHETWTAVRDDDAALPDAFAQTVTTGAGVEDLAFRDLDGTPTRVADLLDAGGAPARILYLFGSWCPNCADAGAEMKRLKAKYGNRLTVVGLAFEQTEDFERSARQVGLYLERHNADWPVLIAGLADKAKASAELPVLDRVRAYPTTIFLDADNTIVAVHTGFSGPATGDAHREQQAAFGQIIDGLIAP